MEQFYTEMIVFAGFTVITILGFIGFSLWEERQQKKRGKVFEELDLAGIENYIQVPIDDESAVDIFCSMHNQDDDDDDDEITEEYIPTQRDLTRVTYRDLNGTSENMVPQRCETLRMGRSISTPSCSICNKPWSSDSED